MTEFLKKKLFFFQGPVQVNIAVPMMTEKAEWKLNGQTLNITLQLSDTVATMKALIHEQTGMPPGKQKLQYEVMIIDKLFTHMCMITNEY